MKLRRGSLEFEGKDGVTRVKRLSSGVPEIAASSLSDAVYALGRVHMEDRQLQMVLTRLIFQGRLSEFISGKDELIETDKYIRSLHLFPDLAEQMKHISFSTMNILKSYVAGINDYFKENGSVFEFKLMRIKPEPWKIEDVLLMAKVFPYFGLVDVQGNMEKFIVQMVQNDIDEKRLRELFPYLTDKIDIDLLKKVKLQKAPVDEVLNWISKTGKFTASNNWVVSGKRSSSGSPILAGDPHLEVNRMPAIWYDAIMKIPDNTISGFSMPGMPAVLAGRTSHLSFSPTFSFADLIDYRIEECSSGKYKRGSKWIPFDVHRENIGVRGGENCSVEIYENEHGILEGNPFEDGFYLVRSWSCRRDCGAMELNSALGIMEAKSVREAMRIYRNMETSSFNFLMADSAGNIGYQMTGRICKRPRGVSGLIPRAGWERRNDSRGFIDPGRLPSEYNPRCGYLVTANNDLNHMGEANPINLPIANYRHDRIENIITGRKELDVELMKDMQYDLYSLQAHDILKYLADLIPDCENGMKLKNWDCRYNSDSEGAVIFENLYESLMKIIFGQNGFGEDVVDYILRRTSLFHDYFGSFDKIIMSDKSLWFMKASGRDLKRMAIDRALAMPVKKYGETRNLMFDHLLFGKKLPKIFGFSHGPISLPGGRATILQGQIFEVNGRTTTFSPSARIIADMSEDVLHENLPGGTSDRRFSKLYTNNMKDWLEGVYKKLK